MTKLILFWLWMNVFVCLIPSMSSLFFVTDGALTATIVAGVFSYCFTLFVGGIYSSEHSEENRTIVWVGWPLMIIFQTAYILYPSILENAQTQKFAFFNQNIWIILMTSMLVTLVCGIILNWPAMKEKAEKKLAKAPFIQKQSIEDAWQHIQKDLEQNP